MRKNAVSVASYKTTGPVMSLKFDPFGDVLAFAAGNNASVGNVKGQLLKEFSLKNVTALTWTNDGHYLAVGGEDRVVKIFSDL